MKKYISLLFVMMFLYGTVQAQERYRHQEVPQAKAKAVIYIYLDGGSAQTDTFDPKPEAGRNYFGKYPNPIKTTLPGVMFGQRLRHLATLTDKFSVIRTMTNNGNNAHETSHYITLTGDMTNGGIVYPSFCSMISYLKEEECKSRLFPYITLVEASTRFNEAGFLPNQYKPYDTGGNPNDKVFNVDGIFSEKVSTKRIAGRKEMIDKLNSLSEEMERIDETDKLHSLQNDAVELLTGEAKDVFNLSKEDEKTRNRYGRTTFGQSCLAARRLIQEGVIAVCVRYRGWDTHKEHFARMDERLDDLDCGLSALIEDLDRLGLLKTTIIICGGEFGRTPRISWEPPWNGGRGHYGKTYSYVVAGGGLKGGQVIGKTDKTGENVVERPVYPCDLIATVYTLMGIDPKGEILHPTAGYIPLLPSYGNPKTSAGLLTELF
ncbi:MAG: DUF1501 domain-containing protein [Alistipes sp.]|nr:DUF1501 domain-containing protein [Candidatus Alistipes equi]